VELGELFSLGDLKHSLIMKRGEGITNVEKSQTQREVNFWECTDLSALWPVATWRDHGSAESSLKRIESSPIGRRRQVAG
jgi:hypothetical protein